MLEQNNYTINTGDIYIHEYSNWQPNPDLKESIARMESLILHLLQKNNLPAVTSKTHDDEYFKAKRDQFENYQLNALESQKHPFTFIFVETESQDSKKVLSSDSHTFDEIVNYVFNLDTDRKWIMYDYAEPYIIQKDVEDPEVFEFFFAFKLRQIDIMQTDEFLAYHIIASYEDNRSDYHRFLDLIIRKYHDLFDEDKRKTIAEWLAMNQTSKTDQKTMIKDTDKIEWLGSQKELAELFIELKQKGWIKQIEHKKIKNTFTSSHSIQQVLKPSVDKKTLEPMYEQVYTADYTSKFDQIEENPK
jgi:hypothetical protein